MKKKKKPVTHHDLCGACSDISIKNTPPGFPLPGDVAEKICGDNPPWALTHRRIALAISERDRMWKEKIKKSKK